MTRELAPTINQSKVQHLLGMAADGCGGALNSLLVVLGDKCGLYATRQYSFDMQEPIVRRKAPSIAQKHNSDKAAGGPAHTHDDATQGEDRARSVQRVETAFMTLMCHECAAATDSHTRTPPRSPQGQL